MDYLLACLSCSLLAESCKSACNALCRLCHAFGILDPEPVWVKARRRCLCPRAPGVSLTHSPLCLKSLALLIVEPAKFFHVLTVVVIPRDGCNHFMRNLAKDALGVCHVALAEPVDFLKLLFRSAHSRQFHSSHREIILAVHIANGQQFRHFQAVIREDFLPNQRPGMFVVVEKPLAPNRQHDAFLPHSYFLLVSCEDITRFF